MSSIFSKNPKKFLNPIYGLKNGLKSQYLVAVSSIYRNKVP